MAYVVGQPVTQAVKSCYIAMRRGELFTATHQTPSTTVTAQTSYVATTPTFIIEQSGATRSIVGFEYWLSQEGTVAGGVISIRVAIDSVARRASAGTEVVEQNCNMASTTTSSATVYYNPTASNPNPVTQRVIWSTSAAASLGTVSTFDFEDGLGIGTTGSILIYTWASTTAPTWSFGFRWKEEVVNA